MTSRQNYWEVRISSVDLTQMHDKLHVMCVVFRMILVRMDSETPESLIWPWSNPLTHEVPRTARCNIPLNPHSTLRLCSRGVDPRSRALDPRIGARILVTISSCQKFQRGSTQKLLDTADFIAELLGTSRIKEGVWDDTEWFPFNIFLCFVIFLTFEWIACKNIDFLNKP